MKIDFCVIPLYVYKGEMPLLDLERLAATIPGKSDSGFTQLELRYILKQLQLYTTGSKMELKARLEKYVREQGGELEVASILTPTWVSFSTVPKYQIHMPKLEHGTLSLVHLNRGGIRVKVAHFPNRQISAEYQELVRELVTGESQVEDVPVCERAGELSEEEQAQFQRLRELLIKG
jgi:hypothetical protein